MINNTLLLATNSTIDWIFSLDFLQVQQVAARKISRDRESINAPSPSLSFILTGNCGENRRWKIEAMLAQFSDEFDYEQM